MPGITKHARSTWNAGAPVVPPAGEVARKLFAAANASIAKVQISTFDVPNSGHLDWQLKFYNKGASEQVDCHLSPMISSTDHAF
ncbi:MAG: hypothetical protein WC977_00505 [Anaerovoracaceae bacterium]